VLGGAYAGATFPRMGFEVRAAWGSGERDVPYTLQSSRIDGLHLFRPDDRVDPLLVYGVGYRSTGFRTWSEEQDARHLGLLENPMIVVFGEAGGGVIVRVAGPVHVRLDTRVWLGSGFVAHGQQPFAGLDAALGVELRPAGRPDRDGDGIVDRDDACPEEPEDIDRLLDEDGCPDVDVDRDGIADVDDRCDTRRETVNQYEDTDGCPDVVPEAVAAMPPPLRAFAGTIEGIVFENDSAEILPRSEPALDAAAVVLRAYPEVRVVIRGHTDAIADDAYNLALSKARAESVSAWLVAHGVEPARLSTEGLGESSPIDTNDTEEGRARNRRVEFLIAAR
jgi:outer membrane protein OmpA-like peptidoglycan-associated protein